MSASSCGTLVCSNERLRLTYIPETEAQWRARVTRCLKNIVEPLCADYRAGTAMDYGFDVFPALAMLRIHGNELKAELKQLGWDIDASIEAE